jgi:hypothetical protein
VRSLQYAVHVRLRDLAREHLGIVSHPKHLAAEGRTSERASFLALGCVKGIESSETREGGDQGKVGAPQAASVVPSYFFFVVVPTRNYAH